MARTISGISLAVLLGCSTSIVQAQGNESCDSIIAQGLRNITESFGESRTKKHQYDHVCKSSDYRSNENRAQAIAVEAFGYGRGGGSNDYSSAIERLDRFCQINKSQFENQETRYDKASSFSEAALAAWRDCKAMNADGMKTWVQSGSNSIAINLAYSSIGTDGVMTIAEVSADGAVRCSMRVPVMNGRRVERYKVVPIPFAQDAKVVALTESAVTIQCTRPTKVTKIRLEDGREVDGFPGGQILISTSRLPYVFTLPDKPLNLPVSPSAIDVLAERVRVLEQQVLRKGAAIALKAHTGHYVGVTGLGSAPFMTLNIGVPDQAPRSKHAGEPTSHERFTIESHDDP